MYLCECRHAGDLGNITAGADGVAKVEISDVQIPLTGPNSIVGRSLVVSDGQLDAQLPVSSVRETGHVFVTIVNDRWVIFCSNRIGS